MREKDRARYQASKQAQKESVRAVSGVEHRCSSALRSEVQREKATGKAATNAAQSEGEKVSKTKYNELYENMMYKRKIRAKMTPEEKEYSKIGNVIAVRKHRESRDGKKLLIDRMKARQGMEDFWKFGQIGEFAPRESREKDESKIWKKLELIP